MPPSLRESSSRSVSRFREHRRSTPTSAPPHPTRRRSGCRLPETCAPNRGFPGGRRPVRHQVMTLGLLRPVWLRMPAISSAAAIRSASASCVSRPWRRLVRLVALDIDAQRRAATCPFPTGGRRRASRPQTARVCPGSCSPSRRPDRDRQNRRRPRSSCRARSCPAALPACCADRSISALARSVSTSS